MKTLRIVSMSVLCLLASTWYCQAQQQEATQLALNLEKLRQFKAILQSMYKTYQILQDGYDNIKNIAEGNFNLHDAFLDRLLKVNPAVKKYHKVARIVRHQQLLVEGCRRSIQRIRADNNFSSEDVQYMKSVFDRLIKGSLDNLEELLMVITAAKLRMSDQERLRAIDRISATLETKLHVFRRFDNDCKMLSNHRAKANSEINTTKQLHQIEM
ncbi:TerB family tellurite resistance protein [Pseudochryseolinea flava]|uniref:TerB family tellurite resistance protein n=1 Tax=Pseudochryseolinea flava TaxID=2059302 RepID=A0A364XZH4_9BACT|nr:TerB family tellurite resistance protein [Pseudochryseolinea flava]RAV98852.1 TerB family tellurite resistance protein [Pseudochryseolinea flava]